MGSEDKSGRSNHLESHSGTTDRSGGNMHSDSHPRDINGNWKHLEIIPELFGRSGTSTHSETRPQVTNGSGSIDLFGIKPEVVEGNKSTNPFETVPELPDGNESVSSSEDLFRVDTELGNFGSRTQPSKDEEINASNKNSSKSKALDNSPVPASTSRLSQFTNELMVHDMPPTQSPPIQVMDRSGEYDPLRIPSAIFETSKSSTPQEWSAASNESLFSIHIGNNSFSRDQFKSGELTKTDDMIMFNPSPTIPEVRADGEGSVFEKSDANGGSVKNTKEGTTVDKSQEKAPPANVLRNPSDMSSHSNESSCSFVFPIKKKMKKMKKRCCACGCVPCIPFFCCRKKCKRKKCAWPSCYCSNCSCTFCYCSWPSCYFRWPSCYCSNCSWAFCYCWNCSLKRWCCHSSTTLTDRVKSASVKPDVEEKKQKKPLATEVVTQKSSTSCCCCCLSWFSCRPCSWSFPSFHCSSCCCCCRRRRCCCCR
ncbi:hypothetical protein AB3S75_035639 [Citrus x aurantiifolia]